MRESKPVPKNRDVVLVVDDDPKIADLVQLYLERAGFEVAIAANVRVRADPDALAQVLGNLLQNAGRYTPDGGTVWVRASADAESVLVSVANSGTGISADDLPHLFERFYRVEKSRDAGTGGAGIGLAVVKELIEAAAGRVGVDSEPGLTRFWFSLSPGSR